MARALAMEGAYASADGGKAERRTAEVLGRARALSERLGDPYALALTTLTEGVAATLTGRWRAGHDACERAEAGFRSSTGVMWEMSTTRWFSLWGLVYLGGLAEAASPRPGSASSEAEDRGDLYAAVCHATGLANLVWLAAGDPDTARARCREALSRWSKRTFHVEHWCGHPSGRGTSADLYRGDPRPPPTLRRRGRLGAPSGASLLLMVQLTRLEVIHLRARASLALRRARPAERRAPRHPRGRGRRPPDGRRAHGLVPTLSPPSSGAGAASLGGHSWLPPRTSSPARSASSTRPTCSSTPPPPAGSGGGILFLRRGASLVAGAGASMRREGIVIPGPLLGRARARAED